MRSIYELWSKQDVIKEAQTQLKREEQKSETLKNELKTAQTPEFVESQARNELFLSKPDEKEIIIASPSSKPQPQVQKELSSWQKWLDLFL